MAEHDDWTMIASFDGATVGVGKNVVLLQEPDGDLTSVEVMTEDGEVVWKKAFEAWQPGAIYYYTLIRELIRHEFADGARARNLDIDDIIEENDEKATEELKNNFFT